MCLLLMAFHAHPKYRLIFAANRDEFLDRPSSPARFWEDTPSLLAGKDLRGGGTWLGITKKGRIAALTNIRNPAQFKEGAPSRGRLVSNFLKGDESPPEYFNRIDRTARDYNGFNFIAGNMSHLWWYSNWKGRGEEVPSGVHGLSNRFLNTPWPKVSTGKRRLTKLLMKEKNPSPQLFFDLLSDRTVPPDEDLPDTGVGIEWERTLSPLFIKSPTYGTRCSTVIMIENRGVVTFIEKTFFQKRKESTIEKYEFEIKK